MQVLQPSVAQRGDRSVLYWCPRRAVGVIMFRVGGQSGLELICEGCLEVTMPAQLDAIDRQILKELQDNGRITNVELAHRVGISAPPCLRRVRPLQDAGYINGYRALLDEKKLGFEVTAFAMVHLSSQAEADLTAFEQFVRTKPFVRECWMLSGEIDFILKCVAPNLSSFQTLVTELTAAPQVRNVKTSLTLRNSKNEAMVPFCPQARYSAAARVSANDGVTNVVNSSSECSDSSGAISPNASHDTK